MKQYRYKIQWLFPLTVNFSHSTDVTNESLLNDLFNVIKVLGYRSLDWIVARDSELNIISRFTTIQYGDFDIFRQDLSDWLADCKAINVELLKK